MRIAHITNSGGMNFMGVERYVLTLAAAQSARGQDVTIITDRPGVLADSGRRQNLRVIVTDQAELTPPSGRPAAEAVQRLLARFRQLGIELIHCHTLPAAACAIPAGNQIRTPCILTLHANKPPGTPPSAVNPVVAARNSGVKFAVIAVSRKGFDDLRLSGMPEAELYYIPAGTRTLPPAHRQADGQAQSSPNLILVGSLELRKGIDIAILTMACLRRRRGSQCPVLSIYGGESYDDSGVPADYFREMARALELDDVVRFRGVEVDILERCPSTDVLIVPSRAETGPLVVLEAMSRGMPVVATDVGEVTEMLPDCRYGRVVRVNSVLAFTDAVESILADISAGQFDPGLLVQRHQSLYSTERMADRIEAVYSSVIPG